ncbi:hypothetical protein O181_058663 [Austropuccinia psidii MF-1]|uniref:PRKR-interacting protein 1 n=1 Tax=Austropuccinia psidii MF-1 TaxID=1389203 RepID=A0A9Q3HVR8_9BASI|nr:hypothetical protein [Austropuccinia psidii MF-1]
MFTLHAHDVPQLSSCNLNITRGPHQNPFPHLLPFGGGGKGTDQRVSFATFGHCLLGQRKMTDTDSKPSKNPAQSKNKKPKLDPKILPANKHAPTPLEKQRLEVAKLLQDPTRKVHLPKPAKEKTIRPPREMIKNVQGSSAGAGSGEFHVYKQSRRREYERLRLMDEKEQKDKETAEFEKKQAELKSKADTKTAARRSRRQRRKENARKKRQQNSSQPNDETKATDDDVNDSSSSEEEAENAKKRKKLGAAPVGEGMKFKRPKGSDDEEEEDKKTEESDNNLKQSIQSDSKTTDPSQPDAPVVESNGLKIVEDES